MPELPEVETVRRGLAPVLEGKRILRAEARRPDLRFPLPENFAGRLTGRTFGMLGRRAKYLVAELDRDEALIMHLGMTGRFTVSGAPTAGFVHETGGDNRHDHVVFHVEGGQRVVFNDARRFGFMELWPLAKLDDYPPFAELGPEPLSNAFSGPYLRSVLKGRRSPIKAALLDQSVVAGLGNIYVCEVLFRSGISPLRPSGAISAARLDRLAEAIRAVIEEAIAAGGSSISDFAAADGGLGYFQHRFQVYDREGRVCHRCGGAVTRIVQSGRSSFYCRKCQR